MVLATCMTHLSGQGVCHWSWLLEIGAFLVHFHVAQFQTLQKISKGLVCYVALTNLTFEDQLCGRMKWSGGDVLDANRNVLNASQKVSYCQLQGPVVCRTERTMCKTIQSLCLMSRNRWGKLRSIRSDDRWTTRITLPWNWPAKSIWSLIQGGDSHFQGWSGATGGADCCCWQFNQPCLSEKHAAINVFAGYACKLIYIFTDFQVTERFHWGPEFFHYYTMG